MDYEEPPQRRPAPPPEGGPPRPQSPAGAPPRPRAPEPSFSGTSSGGGGGEWWNTLAAKIIAGVIVLVVILGIVSKVANVGPLGRDTSTWYAVFMSDNEIFFGHLQSVDSNQLDLTNVFYLQRTGGSTTGGTTGTAAPQALSLAGIVSNQIQCPQDQLSINRTLVLYWQALRSDSLVVQKLNNLVTQPQKCFVPTVTSQTPAPAPPSSGTPNPAGTAPPSPSGSASASPTP